MNRDEILTKSRAENVMEDERGRLTKLESARFSHCVFLILYCTLCSPGRYRGLRLEPSLFRQCLFSVCLLCSQAKEHKFWHLFRHLRIFHPHCPLLPSLRPGAALTAGPHPTQTPANQPVFAFPISMEAPKARPSKAQALPNQDHMVIRPHGLFV